MTTIMAVQFLSLVQSRETQARWRVIHHKRTSMNFFMLFATWAANLILVIGRRFAVKSVTGI